MDIVSRLPFALGRAVGSGASSALSGTADYDFAFAGQAFISGASDQRSYTRGLAPVRKDQFDNNREPGEQSLANWWLRNQNTFIGGEGILYQDPDQVSVANLQNRHTIQYGHSVGVNPWVNGKATLLRATTQRIADASGNNHFVAGWDNAGTASFYAAFGNLFRSDNGAATTNVTWGGANTIVSLTTDGSNYYAADSVGIYRGAGVAAGALLWNTGSANTTIGWVKGRLMAGITNKIYELQGGAPPVLPTPKFTHLNASWVWTAFTEGTNAIYASGFAGAQSQIYKFTLDTSGNVPTLTSGGATAAQLPLGEIVYSLYGYLGSFIGIGTNRGFRVGQIDSNGDITYGPLIVTTTNPVKTIAAYDRFFFFGVTNGIDGFSGLVRVDLGQPIYDSSVAGSLRFAYAMDLQTHLTGAVTGVTNFGTSDRMVIGQVGQGSYLENSAILEPTGYMTTGRIRYSTMEAKLYKFLTVRTPSIYRGTLLASVVDPGGAQTSVMTITEGSGLYITDIAMSAPNTAVEYVSLRFDYTRSTVDTTTGPEINAWQLKALPGAIRQRIFTVPLLCFDLEKDKNGQMDGYEGRTLDRLEAFEALAQRGDSLTFEDVNARRSYIVVIDDYQFEQKAAPGNNAAGYGGYLTVQVRTIADTVPTS